MSRDVMNNIEILRDETFVFLFIGFMHVSLSLAGLFFFDRIVGNSVPGAVCLTLVIGTSAISGLCCFYISISDIWKMANLLIKGR